MFTADRPVGELGLITRCGPNILNLAHFPPGLPYSAGAGAAASGSYEGICFGGLSVAAPG